MPTTDTGVADTGINTGLNDLDDAAGAFMQSFEDVKKPSKEDETEDKQETADEETESEATDEEGDTETSDESPEDEGEETSDEEAEETDEKAEKTYADDDVYVKVKVDGADKEASIKDLKRLYGQEQSLTRKSQEVADLRKQADADVTRNLAVLNALVKRAEQKSEPFKKMDFLVLSKSMEAEELQALRQVAQESYEDERFLKEELGNFQKAIQGEQLKVMQTTAAETIKTLSDPGTTEKPNPLYIEGWNNQVYQDLRSFAMKQGLEPEIVNNLVQAPAFKILHMAMSYAKGAQKVATQKVNKTPKKIVKASTSPKAASSKQAKHDKALKDLRSKGTIDNAANAFFERMSGDEGPLE